MKSECAICAEEFHKREVILQVCCGNRICRNCIRKSIADRKSFIDYCLFCNAKLKSIDIGLKVLNAKMIMDYRFHKLFSSQDFILYDFYKILTEQDLEKVLSALLEISKILFDYLEMIQEISFVETEEHESYEENFLMESLHNYIFLFIGIENLSDDQRSSLEKVSLSNFLLEICRDVMRNVSESIQTVDDFMKLLEKISSTGENRNEKLCLMYNALGILSKNRFSFEENLKLISTIDRIFEITIQRVNDKGIKLLDRSDIFIEIFLDKNTYISCPDCDFGYLVYGEDHGEIKSCNQCDKKKCNRCLTLHEMECQKENIERAKQNVFLKCPNCRIAIHVVSGCSHLFCTNCCTKFDKTTMRIISDNELFHNEYYERYLENSKKISSTRIYHEDIHLNINPLSISSIRASKYFIDFIENSTNIMNFFERNRIRFIPKMIKEIKHFIESVLNDDNSVAPYVKVIGEKDIHTILRYKIIDIILDSIDFVTKEYKIKIEEDEEFFMKTIKEFAISELIERYRISIVSRYLIDFIISRRFHEAICRIKRGQEAEETLELVKNMDQEIEKCYHMMKFLPVDIKAHLKLDIWKEHKIEKRYFRDIKY